MNSFCDVCEQVECNKLHKCFVTLQETSCSKVGKNLWNTVLHETRTLSNVIACQRKFQQIIKLICFNMALDTSIFCFDSPQRCLP